MPSFGEILVSRKRVNAMKINSERLAFWFLRLNGFLTIPNFVVHPEAPRDDGAYPQQTDVDLLGVRFPFRAENRDRPMHDFQLFADEHRIQVVLSEVKTRLCKLNGPWTNPKLQNLQKVLCAGGFRPAAQADSIAESLYGTGVWRDNEMVIRIVCFGGRHSNGVKRNFPDVPQLLWQQEVLPFIFQRFHEYHLEKRMHEQWEDDGKELFAAVRDAGDAEGFSRAVEVVGP